MKNTEKAFKWIVGILQENKIPFQLSGGFAARIYGSDRPLYDIDIEVPDSYFDKLLPFIKDYLIYGPQRYLDETFDLLLMTLKYEEQEIDISGCETDKLYNHETQQWESCDTKLNEAVEKEFYGLTVPVIKWQDLVEYKKKIRRSTDLEDVEAILQKNS
ncbi:MAG: hypothetical protein UU46_C0003G0031 [Candidatus Uhrbacteria bacterium GW2011_GWD1_41_16]|uniref:Uncharacterized protein n=1 Tax=Candidatus Uhrbacteria bacterium GW2011_GWC1_41_20 TaxID=1618983 RepID=A0A0G0VF04_9BACT|nr:MAG: hypothetical protein UT52_C0005G0010 [Candidatus Uhrbacteria bacterium GW2011_GWE1_39_46]KKR63642.1 MAG: hypothetical protein UU04_C0015G0031 [Candidatus Uhrbacteria bacterium GW2011_GWC2_40_450]KKR96414.1 MAG: hypothetical protein UU46_C0003G0031 [Candidatus Uhrbacteria bacterium GW2011_GWD1_41_16]KKR99428.1 MAG: hypothetical protein UU50_C0006G0031 [Candidatus Uhrbacteria bacterium GW2011_GWC1_41_20]KKS08340.1 MAG: hypothetical protein UU62_C0002G0010 [Candidatus Uhrbacteria bacterium